MPIHRGSFGGAVNLKPTASVTSADQNQNAALIYGSVTANGASTTVTFDYTTDVNFVSFSSVTATGSPVTGFTSTSVSAFISGLAENTTYYYRIRATNSIGTTTTSGLSFLTWHLIGYANGTPGTYTTTIPVGAGQAPTLRYVFIYGSGGASGYGGGGGGGYRLRDSYAFSGTNGAMTFVVGAPGTGAGGAGNNSYIQGTNLTQLLAGGGFGGPTNWGANGGSVGSGDNPGYAGGTGGAYYDIKTGAPVDQGAGGGGGIGGAGGNGIAPISVFYTQGGNGGAGGSAYGYNGGAGGGGYGTGANGTVGSSSGWGTGGTGLNAGGSNGLVHYYYYGP